MSRVTEIRYVGYGVADLAAERAFYRDIWGLKEVAEQDGMVYFAAEGQDELYVARLRPAAQNRIDVVGLAADTAADVDALHQRAVKAGCKIIFAPRKFERFGGGYGFRFFSPDGITLEVSSDVARGKARELARWEARPVSISHIVFRSPNHKALMQFFVDVLGFIETDWIGEFMGFLRCNQWHHRIAVVPGPPCFDHIAYDMLGIDDMIRGAARVRRSGHEVVWGPGRHNVGDNTFCYFRTPAGFYVEYTAELEQVAENHRPQVHTTDPDVNERWGIGSGSPKSFSFEPDKGLFIPAEA